MERHWPELPIENVGKGPFLDDKEVFLASIAISLKRVADAMAGDSTKLGLIDTLFEIEGLAKA